MTPATGATIPASARRGFSTMELLVIIAIILVIVGLVALVAGEKQGPATATRLAVSGVQAVADFYQQQSGAVANISQPPSGNWNSQLKLDPAADSFTLAPPVAIADEDSIVKFVIVVWSYPDIRGRLRNLGPKIFGDFDKNGFPEVVDGYGNKLLYVMPDDSDPNRAVFPKRPKAFFVSLGLDGQPGTKDDVFSYTLD